MEDSINNNNIDNNNENEIIINSSENELFIFGKTANIKNFKTNHMKQLYVYYQEFVNCVFD